MEKLSTEKGKCKNTTSDTFHNTSIELTETN